MIDNSVFLIVVQCMGFKRWCESWALAVTRMISAWKQIIYGLCGSNYGFAPIPLKTRGHDTQADKLLELSLFCDDAETVPFTVNWQFWLMNFN